LTTAANDFDHRQSSSPSSSAQQTNPDTLEVAAGTVHESIEGWIPDLASDEELAALAFTGRDTAAGKSWEAWTRKYWEKKAAGGTLNLHPESLD